MGLADGELADREFLVCEFSCRPLDPQTLNLKIPTPKPSGLEPPRYSLSVPPRIDMRCKVLLHTYSPIRGISVGVLADVGKRG